MCSIPLIQDSCPDLVYDAWTTRLPPHFEKLYSTSPPTLWHQVKPSSAMYQRRGPCWGREARVLGTQETCLGAGRVAKHLHFGVLHGAGDGTVHEASNSKVWYTQFAFQHWVLYDRETGRPEQRVKRSDETEDSVWALEACRDFPGGPAVKTLQGGLHLIPGQGTKSHMPHPHSKVKKKHNSSPRKVPLDQTVKTTRSLHARFYVIKA